MKFLYTIRMRGAKKRDSREQFLYVFCGSQGACGTLKTKFLYTIRMRAPKKRGSREQFLFEFCGSQGAQTPDYPRHANPGLRSYTPPVKHTPGGHPHLPQIIIIIIRVGRVGKVGKEILKIGRKRKKKSVEK